MTTPAPAPRTGPQFSQISAELAEMPKWALIAVVGTAGVLAWWLFRNAGSSSTPTNTTWNNQAVSYLTSRGYDTKDANNAVTAYTSGSQLTDNDVNLIGQAVQALGTPDMPSGDLSTRSTDLPVLVPSGSGSTTSSSTTPKEYWYVTSLGAGWTATFRGIAQQFYGTASNSNAISAVNPGVATSDYAQIPAGTVITVPRSLN